jgi:protein-S-isoprenylcysteine O-methyltransferase Ste14
MWTLLRHLFAIAVLPFTMTVLVPLWIVRNRAVAVALPSSAGGVLLALLGAALLAVGLTLFVSSLRRFAVDGKGTLGPWDPPRELVVRGPYRYVRNPMISGVVCILFAEALLLRSLPHAKWAAAFVVFNLIFIPLLEEPQLEQRFGDSYRRYCRHVPRIVPRWRPWQG